MVIIKKEVTDEGETIPYQLADLTVTTEIEEENDRVLILWPVTIGHKIDEDSPLYDMNPRDILNSQFEIIMTLEGVTEETGNTIQVRTLFLRLRYLCHFRIAWNCMPKLTNLVREEVKSAFLRLCIFCEAQPSKDRFCRCCIESQSSHTSQSSQSSKTS